jgi:hypothetical protein
VYGSCAKLSIPFLVRRLAQSLDVLNLFGATSIHRSAPDKPIIGPICFRKLCKETTSEDE